MSIPDKFHRGLQKLIKKANPQTPEELRQFLDSLMGKPLPEAGAEEFSPEDQAFDLVDEAWQSSDAKGRKLAEQALKIWPDCIPAYEYLAAKSKSAKERLGFYEKGVEIGQRVFGGKFLEESRGHFWLISETRPYMRCLFGLAFENYQAGNTSKAIVIMEDMLSLNPNDNQGVRYNLLTALLAQKDLQGYHRYRKLFEEENSTMMNFNDALAGFLEKSEDGQRYLRAAMENNPYVVPLLLAPAAPAKNSMPDAYALNSPEEAVIYVYGAWSLWHGIPGALEWLKQQQAQTPKTAKAANAPPLDRLKPDLIRVLQLDPFSPFSPLQFRPGLSDKAVAHLPLLQLTQKMMAEIKAQQPLKLTTKGNLPRKLVHQLYDLRLFPDKYVDDGTVKLQGEEDFMPLNIAHILCNQIRLINKKNDKSSLSKKGEELLHKPALLYIELLKVFTMKFNWAYTERWGYGVEHTGQWGWACILYELLQKGEQEKSNKYYEELYARLYPDLVRAYPQTEIGTQQDKMSSDFRHRFFSRFCYFFGLVEVTREIKGKYDLVDEFYVRRSALADQVFQLK